MARLSQSYEIVQPILSGAAASIDSRFGASSDFRARIEAICRRPVWDSN